MSRDIPIIFSAPMVQALLAGRKTMTRRLAFKDGKPTPWWNLYVAFNFRRIDGHPDYVAGRDGLIYRRKGYAFCPLKAATSSKYPNVSLSTEGTVVTKNVHPLVCRAWYGPPPTDRHEVRHLDSDKLNSCAENLDWALPEGNWTDRNILGRGVRDKHHAAKLTSEKIAEIKASSLSQRDLAALYGVAQSTICSVLNGTTWSAPTEIAPLTMPRPANLNVWVRENYYHFGIWRQAEEGNWHFCPGMPKDSLWFRYDDGQAMPRLKRTERGYHLRPSIYMPRPCSRLTLEVTATKIERLWNISDADALAEGIVQGDDGWYGWDPENSDCNEAPEPAKAFFMLWEKLHGEASLAADPELVALTFTVHQTNIDSMGKAA